jgi:hypothetical protein
VYISLRRSYRQFWDILSKSRERVYTKTPLANAEVSIPSSSQGNISCLPPLITSSTNSLEKCGISRFMNINKIKRAVAVNPIPLYLALYLYILLIISKLKTPIWLYS